MMWDLATMPSPSGSRGPETRAVESALRALAPPRRIGPYLVLDVLGEGGMGTVYLAEQATPITRRVAVKVVKGGLDSAAVVARFEHERQALASMSHDGIARVFDCGTTDDGQPWFAMEYVEGEPLTQYCDRNQLSIRERLALMLQVCAAVQHAHRKGVLHRDLKPSNVLVAGDGADARAKIIDFGLAKAIRADLDPAALLTLDGQIVGTPGYMAPEQADPTNTDVDTRADVYSLGVVLYELLVGALPFAAEELRRGGLVPMLERLRTRAPLRPSACLAAAGAAAAEIAADRRTTVASLQQALEADLDWLVLKALEPERERRYGSIEALAADVSRHLDELPLSARPPSGWYRLRKFTRRHRLPVLAGALLALTLVAGAIGTAVGFAEAKAKEQLASQRAAQNEELAQRNAVLARDAEVRAAEAIAAQRVAEERTQDFNMLQGLPLLEEARSGARDLLAGSHNEAECRQWLDYWMPRFDELARDLEVVLPRTERLLQSYADSLHGADEARHGLRSELLSLVGEDALDAVVLGAALVLPIAAPFMWRRLKSALMDPAAILPTNMVELQLAVAMVGIFAGVAVPAWLKHLRRSKTSEATSRIRDIAAADTERPAGRAVRRPGALSSLTEALGTTVLYENLLELERQLADIRRNEVAALRRRVAK